MAAPANILVLGDSISAAYGMAPEQGWVSLLQERIKQRKLPYVVHNLSVSGDTSANALRRLPDNLKRYRPALVILQIGGNDGLRALSLEAMQRNMARIIELSRAAGADVLLLGIRLPPNYGTAYLARFDQVYRDLAHQYELPLVASIMEGIGGKPQWMQADGIHPNAGAQRIMLELVWRQLSAWFADDSERSNRSSSLGTAAQMRSGRQGNTGFG